MRHMSHIERSRYLNEMISRPSQFQGDFFESDMGRSIVKSDEKKDHYIKGDDYDESERQEQQGQGSLSHFISKLFRGSSCWNALDFFKSTFYTPTSKITDSRSLIAYWSKPSSPEDAALYLGRSSGVESFNEVPPLPDKEDFLHYKARERDLRRALEQAGLISPATPSPSRTHFPSSWVQKSRQKPKCPLCHQHHQQQQQHHHVQPLRRHRPDGTHYQQNEPSGQYISKIHTNASSKRELFGGNRKRNRQFYIKLDSTFSEEDEDEEVLVLQNGSGDIHLNPNPCRCNSQDESKSMYEMEDEEEWCLMLEKWRCHTRIAAANGERKGIVPSTVRQLR